MVIKSVLNHLLCIINTKILFCFNYPYFINTKILADVQIVNNAVLKKCAPAVKEALEAKLGCADGIGFLVFGPQVIFFTY